MQCKPGDLAVVIDAYNPSNLGMIVRVLGPQDMSSDLVIHDASGAWMIESHYPMTWVCGEKVFYRTKGPALDCQLKPIRGLPIARGNAQARKKSGKKKNEGTVMLTDRLAQAQAVKVKEKLDEIQNI